MDEVPPSPLSTVGLLRQSWRLFRDHLRIFVLLMGFPIAAGVLGGTVIYFLLPVPAGMPLREEFLRMSDLAKFVISLLFLANLAVFYHVLGAAMWAAGESYAGRDFGLWEAVRNFRGKHARLFWLFLIIGMLSARGPLVVIPLAVGFALAPAIPVAKLENLGVFKAIQRGDALNKGRQGRVALFYILHVVLFLAGLFGLFQLLIFLQDSFGNFWFLRPVAPLGFWILLLIPELYMVVLTLNYLDARSSKRE